MKTRKALLGAGLMLVAGASGLFAQPQPRPGQQQDQRPAQPPAAAPGVAAAEGPEADIGYAEDDYTDDDL